MERHERGAFSRAAYRGEPLVVLDASNNAAMLSLLARIACSGRQFARAGRVQPSCWNGDSSRCAPSALPPGCSISWSRSAASGWERCPTGGISALGRRT
jgi:hypothetical protein